MEVAEWLRALGLEQYETAFRENGVRAEVLCHLTAEDLKELGVTAVGHRRELLVAIAKLNEQRTTDTVSPAAVTALGPPHEATASGGERRQLTVMFCDLGVDGAERKARPRRAAQPAARVSHPLRRCDCALRRICRSLRG